MNHTVSWPLSNSLVRKIHIHNIVSGFVAELTAETADTCRPGMAPVLHLSLTVMYNTFQLCMELSTIHFTKLGTITNTF